MESRARWSLVAAGSLVALGAGALPWLAPRLALGGIGAWMVGRGLGLAPALAFFAAAGCCGSAAWLDRGPRGEPGAYASFAQIGIGIALLALVLAWRRAHGPRWAGALGILLALCASFWSARSAGVPGEFLRWLCVWVGAPIALFACAGFASETGVLRGRNWIQALALAATILALAFPVRCALVGPASALLLALCAADALQSAAPPARALSAAACVLLAGLCLFGGAPEPGWTMPEACDAQDEWVRWRREPARDGALAWEVEVDARAPVASVLLVLQSCAEPPRRVEVPLARSAHAGGASFTHAPVALARLPEPAWSARLELHGAGGEQIAERVIGALLLPRAPGFSPALLGFLLAALCLVFVRGALVRAALVGCALVAAQAAWLYALA